ncbi:hypothetical protein [Rubrivirga sp. IMCC45206]|uniref:hypothetical protein n=1 Tax=Rubrivirga sp. IMCC45206 TaxID=3391614 RepID=UPI0039901A6B
MPPGPWDDPTIQAYLREWRRNVEQCIRAVHPRCTVDPFGRMIGVTNAGGVITLNRDPDPIPDTVIPTSREYYYMYFHAATGTRFYPLTGSQYVQSRIEGASPGALTGCTP